MFLTETPEGLALHQCLDGVTEAGHVELDLSEPMHLQIAALVSMLQREQNDATAEVDAVLESLGLQLGDSGGLEPATRQCRLCGCTDTNACATAPFGDPCHWVEDDLCSGCAPLIIQPRTSLDQAADWVTRMAVLEGDCEIGAGSPTHPLRTDAAVLGGWTPAPTDAEIETERSREAGMARVLAARGGAS